MNTDLHQQTGRVTRGEDGVYRWLYEYKMFSNPAMLFMLWRMFFWAIGIGWIILIPFALILFAGWDSLFAVLLDFAVTVLVAAFTLGTIGYQKHNVHVGGLHTRGLCRRKRYTETAFIVRS